MLIKVRECVMCVNVSGHNSNMDSVQKIHLEIDDLGHILL